jgi:lipopolysaccharide biosynthesis regulator YciM
MLQYLWQWVMNPTHQRWGLILLGAFIIGLIFGRLGRFRQQKRAKLDREGDEAFFKGIQYILSNDHDQAIEQFTKFVQVNSETIETYIALGSLYRSKGDIDRAIRIRQSIILRPNVDEQIKFRALIDLGLDYRKGGFLNWALETFKKVLEKQPSNLETLKEIEKIYEETKDWENAFDTRQKIAKLEGGNHNHILAHQRTEIGKLFFEKGEFTKAHTHFRKAIAIYPGCVDALLHLGDLHFQKQDYHNAIKTWKKVLEVNPKFTFLVYRRLTGVYHDMENLSPVFDFLEEITKSHTADAFSHLALAHFLFNKQEAQRALQELEKALAIDPGFWEARKLMGEILLAQGMQAEALAAYQELIARLNIPYLKFQCNNCGYRPNDLEWQCPQCKKWDTILLHDPSLIEDNSQHPPPNTALAVPPAFSEERT